MAENQLQINSKPQEFISLDEAAQQLGVGTNALRLWLKRNPEIKNKYVSKEQIFGRKRFVINVEALLVIANLRNLDSKNEHRVRFSEGKKKLAEKTIESKLTKQLSNIDLLRQLQVTIAQQIENYDKLNTHEERIEIVEQKVDELDVNPEMAITDAQRQFLQERVNALHFKLAEKNINIHQSLIRKELNESVGRHSVNEYTFQDYYISKGILKKMFKKHGFEW
jgi:hypothetical protein